MPPPSTLLGFHHRFVLTTVASARTLLLLHGTGGDENDLLGLGQVIAPAAALLSPRGKVLENGMPRFFRRLAEGVFDEADLKRRTDELADFVAAAAAEYHRDPQHVTAVGFSNGANIAGAMLLKRPDVLEAAVLIRPMVPFESPVMPPLHGKPVLLLSSKEDPLVPVAQVDRLAALLRDGGANVTVQWSPGGHALTEADVLAARNWIAALPPAEH